nr:Ig-like domain-containing protein [Deltaproteobacteria bacterium]
MDPAVVRAGGVASVKITGAPGDLPVLVRASVGTLGTPVRETDGWRVSWTAPKTTAPLVGVFTVADATWPELAFATAVARIPAKQAVKVDVPAGSKSVLSVGETKIGPVAATGTSATFDVDVDPQARTGTLDITRADGTTESRGVILATGTAALAWIPGPASFAGQSTAILRLAAVGADGGMLVATAPRVTSTAGTVRDLRLEGQLWRVELALPPAGGAFTVAADFAGAKAELKLNSAPLTPVRVTAGALPAEGGDVEIKAPTPAALEVREGKGTPKIIGPETVVRLVPAGDRVSVVAHPVVVPSALSPRRIAVWSDVPVMAADGVATAGITVAVLDAAGAPLKDAEVAIRLVVGDGAIASTARTDAHGLAHLIYTASKTPGPAGIRLDVGTIWTEFPIFQAAGPTGPALAVPLDPVSAAWRDATTWTTVYREGKA